MSLEIERKFLVDTKLLPPLRNGSLIRQGYLLATPDKSIRLRLIDQSAILTIKGPTKGISRLEFEYAIPQSDALEIWGLCGDLVVEKTRYRIPQGEYIWEIDEFHGRHRGLYLAEIELRSERDSFFRPEWLGEEVSEDPRYTNAVLAQKS